ncbi:MAG: fused MFS/spermidine synthase [Anaerolineae bacterium]|nr:fused MFS/spermidine synthase [Anaerolineae bacterium]
MPETTRATRARRTGTGLLFLVVFVSGMTTMAVEMAASRLLGPYFGDSILVWANLIGLILIYLTVGAALGGRWADRSPRVETLYAITTVAATLIGLTPLIAAPILRGAQRAFARTGIELAFADAVQIGGSLVAVLVLFAPSITLLGCVSPFAIRLVTKQIRSAGSSAGRVYALSTVGSILGTFLPVLLTIPAIGTARTFLLFSALLFAVSLLGLALHRRTRHLLVGAALLVCVGALAIAFPQRVVKADARMIAERESRYNYIQVLEVAGVRYLMLNEGQGVHSIYDPRSLATTGTWDTMTIAPFFNPPPFTPQQVRRVCVIGLAGGTVARQATAAYGPIPIDGVEIDPAIVEVGRAYFSMDIPNLHVYTMDGRYYLEQTEQRYDLIVVDAYRLPYIPFQLATSEFFALARARLTPTGVIAVNVGRTESDYRMVEAIAATLGAHFASVHAVNLPDTFNTVIVATPHATQPANLTANLAYVDHPFLHAAIARTAANPHPLVGDGLVFTDDRAPVEQLTNAIILHYLLVGE